MPNATIETTLNPRIDETAFWRMTSSTLGWLTCRRFCRFVDAILSWPATLEERDPNLAGGDDQNAPEITPGGAGDQSIHVIDLPKELENVADASELHRGIKTYVAGHQKK